MKALWRNELYQFLFLVFFGLMVGWFMDAGGWALSGLLLFYSFWMLLRLKDLANWVDDFSQSKPQGPGIWQVIGRKIDNNNKRLNEKNRDLIHILSRAQLSINAIDEAVVITNPKGAIQWLNSSAADLLGLLHKTDYQHPITNLVRDPRFVRFYNEGLYDRAIEIPSPSHQQTMLQISITTFGEKEDRLIIARDITRIHNLEQMRKDFVANVSHELRTPLTVIKGYLETYLDTLDENEHKALYRGMAQMNQQTTRMELLVTDLLLLAKLETDDNHKAASPVNVPRLLQQIYNDIIAINEEKQHQITLQLDNQLYIRGVESELRSAFSNLIINAIKYTPATGTIEITWWQDKKGAHFQVTDNGIGIDSRHIPRLTERFYRADQSRQSRTGGTGLGLAIVKHVMIHHDAQLQITSELDIGSQFTCHFPSNSITQRLVPAVNASTQMALTEKNTKVKTIPPNLHSSVTKISKL